MRARLTTVGFVSVALGLVASSAMAQSQEGDNGLFFRVSAGATFGSDLNLDLAFDPSTVFAGPAPVEQETDIDKTVTFGGAVGFHYPGGTRTELEYRYSTANISAISRTGGASPLALTPADDFEVQLLMSNFYKDFDNNSVFTPFVGFGVGGAFISNGLGDRDAEFAYQGTAGVAVDVAEGLSFDVSYNYTRTTSLEFGPDLENATEAPLDPRQFDGAYSASSFLVSLRKEF